MQQSTSLNTIRNILSTFHSTQKFNHITIENKKVVGCFLTKTCPCHHQIEQNQEKVESDAAVQTVDNKKSISPTIDQFYKLRYSFLYGKGGEVTQVLPAMCFKNNLEEHLFTLLKSIRQNHHFLNDSDGSLKEISVQFFLSQILSSRGQYK